MHSQKAARASGPIALIRREAAPLAPTRLRSGATSKPMPSASGRAASRASSARSSGLALCSGCSHRPVQSMIRAKRRVAAAPAPRRKISTSTPSPIRRAPTTRPATIASWPEAIERAERRLDFRRHAVAVDVPIAARVAQKAAALFEAHRSPQTLGVRPERVDRRTPVGAFGRKARSQAAQPSERRRELGAEWDFTGVQAAQRRRSVRRRQQTVARQHDDRPALSAPLERQRHVDHGQARADDQDRRIGQEAFERASAPRLLGRKTAEHRLGVMAGGEDRDVRRQRLAGRQRQPHSVVPLLDIATARAHALDQALESACAARSAR